MGSSGSRKKKEKKKKEIDRNELGKDLNICVFGPQGVGCRSIVIRYVKGEFEATSCYCPVPEDRDYHKYIFLEEWGEDLGLHIDLGEICYDEDHGISEKTLSSCEGFILTFSVTDKSSFDDLYNYMSRIKMIKGYDEEGNKPILIAGNKVDLLDDREIETKDAIKLAEEWKCQYLETTPKLDTNINEAFMGVIMEIFYDRLIRDGFMELDDYHCLLRTDLENKRVFRDVWEKFKKI